MDDLMVEVRLDNGAYYKVSSIYLKLAETATAMSPSTFSVDCTASVSNFVNFSFISINNCNICRVESHTEIRGNIHIYAYIRTHTHSYRAHFVFRVGVRESVRCRLHK